MANSNPSAPSLTRPVSANILVLGTGIAGLSAALKFAAKSPAIFVTLVCKADPAEGSTRYAQGGIASVWSKQDSFEEHKEDTLKAGAGLCHEDIVELCVHEGPARVRELIELGVEFTKTSPAPGSTPPTDPAEVFDLHREGGHGRRRILHADDLTGWAIEKALLARVAAAPNIRVLENHIAIDLLTEGKVFKRWRKPGRCLGAYVLDIRTGRVVTLPADITVLATGGAGKVYLYTSNPDTATGDGIAIAHRAGARVANLEFMQFHPTCLYHPSARTFLISEAVRGEGGILRNLAGEEFMSKHHPMASLAPRDVVARAIDLEMKRTGDKHVVLDCTAIGPEEFRRKFPHIYETCLKYGLDPTVQPIPVVPAAHYTCGGVLVDANAQTNVEGLYAIGEVACTGLHGANRLASNSLLEAVVFAHRAVEHALPHLQERASQGQAAAELPELPEWDTGEAVQIEEQIDIAANWLEIRHLMWNYVGIVRSNRRLERAKRRLEVLKAEVNAYYWNFLLTKDLVELRNLLTVAELIVQCAFLRKESRGLHYTVDYPKLDDGLFKRDTVL
ncbi:MAG: L-aspartate oxidase [Oligoflexia bacterium]|nr:L-aspartate oxidase [Oligoflexia bacterium]